MTNIFQAQSSQVVTKIKTFNPLKPFCGTYTNSADTVQTLQKAACDQRLHCLLTEFSIKILVKIKNTTQQPVKRKWNGPIITRGYFHSALIG